MLTIGVNTYVSVGEVSSYIQNTYGEDSTVFAYWDGLEQGAKEMFLTKSLLQLEALPYVGRRKFKNQVLEFPRTTASCQEELKTSMNDEIPTFIKYAQIDNAIAMFNIAENQENKQRISLQKNGVSSFSLGDFSETYQGNSISLYNVADQNIITYVNHWLSGGYKVVWFQNTTMTKTMF